MLIYIIPVAIGWLAGYMVNYFADVLPFTRRFSRPTCIQCDAHFTWKNYLLFRPCENGHPRSARTWAAQFSLLIVSAYTWAHPVAKIGYALGFILIIYFATVFIIDLEHRLILHPTSIVGALFGLGFGWLKWGLSAALTGALGGFIMMAAFYYLGVLFSRMRAKRMLARGQEVDDEEALGAGDVILVTILGLILGWPLIWFGLIFGILFGGAVSLLLILWLVVTRRYDTNAFMLFIPYGPYFITSAFLIIFFPRFVQIFVPGN
jgi:Type IV leader peptidase family